MQFSVQVEVKHKPGVADPQGATIERALPTLGFDGLSHVTVGKSIRFSLDAADESQARAVVDDVVARFLTNPVIEDSAIQIEAIG
jgi:phosphoribosylformylglycinamidine synthase PurS subunit